MLYSYTVVFIIEKIIKIKHKIAQNLGLGDDYELEIENRFNLIILSEVEDYLIDNIVFVRKKNRFFWLD